MALKYDQAEMAAVASDLGNGASEVEQRLLTLKSRVDGLVGDGFSGGSGSAAFDAHYAEWDKAAKQMMTVLTQIGGALNQVSVDAGGFDDAVKSTFS